MTFKCLILRSRVKQAPKVLAVLALTSIDASVPIPRQPLLKIRRTTLVPNLWAAAHFPIRACVHHDPQLSASDSMRR